MRPGVLTIYMENPEPVNHDLLSHSPPCRTMIVGRDSFDSSSWAVFIWVS